MDHATDRFSQFLVEHFKVFGFEGQNWMLIFAAALLIFVVVFGKDMR